MLKIRKINEFDIEIIEDTFSEVFKNYHIKDNINSNPYTNYFVICKNDKIIGFINYDVIFDRLELININIIDNEKGNGYGKMLMKYMIENNRFKNITLEVRKDNYIAINMYKSFGFVPVAIRKKYYNGIDGILMERK